MNTITALIPTLYEAIDVVARELVGFIPAVTRNSSAESAALNQTITYPVVGAATTADITPGTNAPDDGDVTPGTDSLSITKSKYSPVRWAGEEQLALGSNGMYNVVLRDQFAQAMRALCNLIEVDLATVYRQSSRAFGTAGVTPFGTANDLSDIANMNQILDDNGAPMADRHIVLSTSACTNLSGKQSVLFKVNESGDGGDLLRRGILGDLEGFALHKSAQVARHTAGTGASYQANGVNALGATSLTVDTGTGTILAGDVITMANGTPADGTTKYVVNTALAAGTVIIGKPGLLAAHIDNDAVALGAGYRANLAFHRAGIHLVTRTPAMPAGGDSASDVMTITDPVSGLSFQVAMYKQYRRVKFEVGIAWGWKAAKTDFIGTLLG